MEPVREIGAWGGRAEGHARGLVPLLEGQTQRWGFQKLQPLSKWNLIYSDSGHLAGMETHRNLPEGPIASFRNPTALDSSIRTDTKAQSLPTSRQFSMPCRLWSHSWSFSGPNSSPLYFNTFFPIHHLMLCVYVTVPLSPCHFIPSFLFLHRKSLGPQRVSECDACTISGAPMAHPPLRLLGGGLDVTLVSGYGTELGPGNNRMGRCCIQIRLRKEQYPIKGLPAPKPIQGSQRD